MKKAILFFLSFGLILALVGSGIFVSAYFSGDGSVESVFKPDRIHNIDYHESLDVDDDVSLLKITLPAGDINITTHAENTLKVDMTGKLISLYNFDNSKYDVVLERNGGTITVSQQWWQYISPPMIMQENVKINIAIPESYRNKLDLDVSSGKVTVDTACTFDQFDFDLSSGDVDLNVTADSANIEVSSGNLAGTLSADELKLNVSSGDVNLNTSASSVKTDISSGGVTLNNSVVCNANIKLSSGKIAFYMPKPEGLHLNLDISSGKFVDHLFAAKNVYQDDGEFTLGNATNAANWKMDISSGSAHLFELR